MGHAQRLLLHCWRHYVAEDVLYPEIRSIAKVKFVEIPFLPFDLSDVCVAVSWQLGVSSVPSLVTETFNKQGSLSHNS